MKYFEKSTDVQGKLIASIFRGEQAELDVRSEQLARQEVPPSG
jgi:hypothetical protein